MHHDNRPRKRMNLHRHSRLSTTSGQQDKLASGGKPEPVQTPVGEMVGGVWVGK